MIRYKVYHGNMERCCWNFCSRGALNLNDIIVDKERRDEEFDAKICRDELRHTESLTGSKFKLNFGKSKFENQIVDAHSDRLPFTPKFLNFFFQMLGNSFICGIVDRYRSYVEYLI